MKTKHTPGLFAAAPDMLELLQKMVEDGEAGMMDEFPSDALTSIPISWLKEARALLSKIVLLT